MQWKMDDWMVSQPVQEPVGCPSRPVDRRVQLEKSSPATQEAQQWMGPLGQWNLMGQGHRRHHPTDHWVFGQFQEGNGRIDRPRALVPNRVCTQ